MGQFQVILVMPSYGLIPAPPHLRHLTILSPFLKVPLPSQFLHFCFFCPVFFLMESSKVDRSNLRAELVLRLLCLVVGQSQSFPNSARVQTVTKPFQSA